MRLNVGVQETCAVIRSAGDQALFHLSANMMKRRMGMPPSRPLTAIGKCTTNLAITQNV